LDTGFLSLRNILFDHLPDIVAAATLNLDRDTVAAMRKDKPLIMP
jgi:hypothetical protein